MTSAAHPAPQPASRVRVLATAAIIVGALAAILPLLNPALDARAAVGGGWLPALLAAHLFCATRCGAVHERFSSLMPHLHPRDDAFSVTVFNARVLRVTDEPARFRSYILTEAGITALLWIAIIGPAFTPLFRAISRLVGSD